MSARVPRGVGPVRPGRGPRARGLGRRPRGDAGAPGGARGQVQHLARGRAGGGDGRGAAGMTKGAGDGRGGAGNVPPRPPTRRGDRRSPETGRPALAAETAAGGEAGTRGHGKPCPYGSPNGPGCDTNGAFELGAVLDSTTTPPAGSTPVQEGNCVATAPPGGQLSGNLPAPPPPRLRGAAIFPVPSPQSPVSSPQSPVPSPQSLSPPLTGGGAPSGGNLTPVIETQT